MTAGELSSLIFAIWPSGIWLPSGADTKILAIAAGLLRYCSFHRTVRSKLFSPSNTCVSAWPPIVAAITLSTSPVLSP